MNFFNVKISNVITRPNQTTQIRTGIDLKKKKAKSISWKIIGKSVANSRIILESEKLIH